MGLDCSNVFIPFAIVSGLKWVGNQLGKKKWHQAFLCINQNRAMFESDFKDFLLMSIKTVQTTPMYLCRYIYYNIYYRDTPQSSFHLKLK